MLNDILLSSGIPDLPIELSSDRLQIKAEQENHLFNLSSVVNLSTAMQYPIAVFNSNTQSKSKVILTELCNGEKIIVVLRAESNKVSGRKVLYVNRIKSIYPKDTKQIISWINQNNLLRYVDKIKATDWLGKQQFNSADVAIPNNSLNSATKIIESFVNPTLLYEKIFSEEQSTRDKVKGNGIYLKAPNGKPTKLNEKQWLQVSSLFNKNRKRQPHRGCQRLYNNGERTCTALCRLQRYEATFYFANKFVESSS